MEFEYTDTFYISMEDFNDMVDKVRSGMAIDKVVSMWACGLDDCDFYRVGEIEDQLKEEIQKWML